MQFLVLAFTLLHAGSAFEHHPLGTTRGHLLVNGPLPANFPESFAEAVAKATGVDKGTVNLTHTEDSQPGLVELSFTASPQVVKLVENEAADPMSALATGALHSFLVAKGDSSKKPNKEKVTTDVQKTAAVPSSLKEKAPEKKKEDAQPVKQETKVEKVPAENSGKAKDSSEGKNIDIDAAMPYGELEAFGREDTAQELTESSVKESNAMVDQLEKAEVAEEKRAVFRALTRLRGAAITSFDGVANSQTSNIDQYNKVNKWRKKHPVHHLADEEADVSKWAFPSNADLLQQKVIADLLQQKVKVTPAKLPHKLDDTWEMKMGLACSKGCNECCGNGDKATATLLQQSDVHLLGLTKHHQCQECIISLKL